MCNATTNTVTIFNNFGTSTIATGQSFTLFDDDDFNFNDGTNKHGDEGEFVAELPETLSYMRDSDDLNENRFAVAYIRPEYAWAVNKGYNQNNITFVRNSNEGNTTLDPYLNLKRDSKYDERDDFWIVYLLLVYQGPTDRDGDPDSQRYLLGRAGLGGTADDLPTNPNIPFPDGASGELVYLESCTDFDRPYIGQPIGPGSARKKTSVHETGHQMGLSGDTLTGFGIMSYEDSDQFVPRHINIMRARVSSPGE